jgi:hypothetical protein
MVTTPRAACWHGRPCTCLNLEMLDHIYIYLADF